MAELQELVQASNQLGITVYRSLPSNKNVCISPISLTTSLLLTRATTGRDLPVKTEWELDSWEHETIHLANQAWIKTLPDNAGVATAVFVRESDPPLPPRAERLFDAKVFAADFADHKTCVTLANQWVKQATRGKLSHAISVFPCSASLFTLNTVYCRANWKHPFVLIDTRIDNFYVDPITTIRTQFMSQKGDFPFTRYQDVDILEMPYENNDMSMIFFLPDADLETMALSPTFLGEALAQLSGPPVRLDITLPQFTHEGTHDLSSFVYQHPDDNRMVQKTYLEINELAPLGPAFSLSFRGVPKSVPEFKANRPFFYAMIHKPTQCVLFLGHLKYPKAYSELDKPVVLQNRSMHVSVGQVFGGMNIDCRVTEKYANK